MYTEYYLNSIDEKDLDIKQNIETLIQKTSTNRVITLPYYAKYIKKNFPNLLVGSFIDYPISSHDNLRYEQIKDILKLQIDYLAITIQFYYLVNRKYDKIRYDIKKNLELCENKQLIYILEYRKFDHQILSKACEILLSCGITTIYPSTGFFLDNLDDNIIACKYLNNQTGINTIVNGNAWTPKHMEQIKNSKLYGFSSNSIHSLILDNNG